MEGKKMIPNQQSPSNIRTGSGSNKSTTGSGSNKSTRNGSNKRTRNGPRTVRIKKPDPWNHTEELTRDQLNAMRDEFWDTAPHYGGKQEIWDALKAAAESEIQLAQTIVSCAGIIVTNPDMTLCYDERGAMYELPLYVLSDPKNLIPDDPDN